jgi:hypothetical protein
MNYIRDEQNDCRNSDRNSDRGFNSQKVALNASSGSAGPLPIITTLLADPINVVSVSVDARRFKDPRVLLTFTGIINLPLGISVTLNFQINRSTGDGSSKVGSTYTFSTLVDILEAESFAFQFFDSDIAPGHYTYSVELSTNSIIDITPGLTIAATLSALAVDEG